MTRDDQPLTYSEMTQIAEDLKRSFNSAITDLKTNLITLSEQMASHKRAGMQRDKDISKLEKVTDTHSYHLIVINRERRNNIRVRGSLKWSQQSN